MSWPGETPNPGMRVLLADDDPMVRRAMSFVLERLGYRVTAVENGTRAWEEASQARHDVVLMDYDMPELDGAQAAQRILEGEVRPWIIGMSGRGEAEFHFRAAGVTDFLAKPFEVAALHAMLKNAPSGSGSGRA